MRALLLMYTDNISGFYQKVLEHGLGDQHKFRSDLDDSVIIVEAWSFKDLYARFQDMVNLLKEQFKE